MEAQHLTHRIEGTRNGAYRIASRGLPTLERLALLRHTTEIPEFAIVVMRTGDNAGARRIHTERCDHLCVVLHKEFVCDRKIALDVFLVLGGVVLGFILVLVGGRLGTNVSFRAVRRRTRFSMGLSNPRC
jgi:hypothetical protein